MSGKSKSRSSFRDIFGRLRNVFRIKSNDKENCLLYEDTTEKIDNKSISVIDKDDGFVEGTSISKYLQESRSTPETIQISGCNSEIVQSNELKESRCDSFQKYLKKENDNMHRNMKTHDHTLTSIGEYESEVYTNKSCPRGFVFMQNIEFFEARDCHPRTGSKFDYDNLIDLLTKMGYECDEKNEYCKSGKISAKEFIANLNKFSNHSDHQKVDSCIVVIMSHGCGDKKFLSSDGKEISVKEICQMLNNEHCRFLRDKPKILIFQFCRTSDLNTKNEKQGKEFFTPKQEVISLKSNMLNSPSFASYLGSLGSVSQMTEPSRTVSMMSGLSSVFSDSGLEMSYFTTGIHELKLASETSASALNLDSRGLQPISKLQVSSDFYLVFSTVGGEVSYRDPKSGSILIKAICHIFKEYTHKDDIQELFRKVSLYIKKMSIIKDSEAISAQTCERTNIGFDKMFYFNPMTDVNM